jgi:hypothetical protein
VGKQGIRSLAFVLVLVGALALAGGALAKGGTGGGGGGGGGGATATGPLSGTWSGALVAPDGSIERSVLTLVQNGSSFSGSSIQVAPGDPRTFRVTGTLSGSAVSLVLSASGRLKTTVAFFGTVSADGNTISGTLDTPNGALAQTFTR